MENTEIKNIVGRIKSILGSITDLQGNGNKTAKIKEELTKLGKEYDYLVCPCEEDCNSGWLYDLTWYREEENGAKYMTEIPFIMESEWDNKFSAIKYDFEKILQSDARLKLMVCNYKEKEDLNNLKNYFATAIQKYKQQTKNSYYLIAMLDYFYEPKFEFMEIAP